MGKSNRNDGLVRIGYHSTNVDALRFSQSTISQFLKLAAQADTPDLTEKVAALIASLQPQTLPSRYISPVFRVSDPIGKHDAIFIYGPEEFLQRFERGDDLSNTVINVRVESIDFDGMVNYGEDSDCGDQFRYHRELFMREGGIIFFMGSHEGRGHGRNRKLNERLLIATGAAANMAEARQSLNIEKDKRSFEFPARACAAMGPFKIRLHTGHPRKAEPFKDGPCPVVEIVAPPMMITDHNRAFLAEKAQGHGFGEPRPAG